MENLNKEIETVIKQMSNGNSWTEKDQRLEIN